jgi:pyruvate-formate lyase
MTAIAEMPTATAASADSPWDGFLGALWHKEINVRAFIQLNYAEYDGDASFLAPATARTTMIWEKLTALFPEERKKGVLDVSQIPSSITAHGPGYIDKEHEVIVGLQTEAPLKRAIMPNGGFRMIQGALKTYGYEPDPNVVETFTKYRKTHNEGVFDAYTPEIRRCRSSHVLTGLPDAYGRGRIIGDYRRVALYGVDRLIKEKKKEKSALDSRPSSEDIIRDREELSEQIRALQELKEMAGKYGFDISAPARTAREAVHWLYFGYLAAVKEPNGAAMSVGRVSTFLVIYFERDFAAGRLTEEQAQEIIDDFVIKLRIVRFFRTPEYDELFAGDPTWVTESIGGMGDDGAIPGCVSPLLVGKQMQFFGARANMAKCQLYAINGGRDEKSGEQVGPASEPVKGEYLDFDEVVDRLEKMMDWLAGVYVNAMNVIHYMHDKYAYERIEMALHDYAPVRTMAFGMAGLSVVADSLSAIKFAKVKVVRDETGLITDYQTEGEFPLYGNNDNRVDQLAVWLVSTFMTQLRKHPTYRNAIHTQSILTITSNVVYGKATGNTPDGRRAGEPFAPGANPMHGRDSHGIHAAGASVAKIPYRDAQDGISLTASLMPTGLGRVEEDRITNMVSILDAFFTATGFHMNVNVLNRDTLMDAMEHPEKYPSLTIRVSGYAVNFVRLTREQQMDVINRTFHGG